MLHPAFCKTNAWQFCRISFVNAATSKPELVSLIVSFGGDKGKMKGCTKWQKMDEPFSFKQDDRSHL